MTTATATATAATTAELNCSATTLTYATFAQTAASSPAVDVTGTCLSGYYVVQGAPYTSCGITGDWQLPVQNPCIRMAPGGARARARSLTTGGLSARALAHHAHSDPVPRRHRRHGRRVRRQRDLAGC